jgi:hypothetical protein
MSFLVALAVIVAIAGACWRVRENRRREMLRLASPARSLHLAPPDPLADSEPLEKSIAGQLGFLQDLKQRERETGADARQPRRPRGDVRRTTVIDAEFREVTNRDSQP